MLTLVSCAERDTTTPSPVNNSGSGSQISDTLRSDLLLDNAPYVVTGDLLIPAGHAVGIAAGVELLFRENTRLIVQGSLTVSGNEQRPVHFRGSRGDKWNGVWFHNTATRSVLRFVTFRDVEIDFRDSLQAGAVGVLNARVKLENAWFRDNFAELGGAISVIDGEIDVQNAVFWRNEAVVYGGALYALRSEVRFVNNTVSQNLSTNLGGAVVLQQAVSTIALNNIFYRNEGTIGDPRIYFVQSDSSLIDTAYNYLQPPGSDPFFVSDSNFHLLDGSPCRDAGHPGSEFRDVNSTRNDQGAYGGPGGDW